MKIIKLFLLFSFVLWAEYKLDIPQNIDVSQLKNIVKNGWNDSNKTLNDLIVSNAQRVMPEIQEKIKNPFQKTERTKENSVPVPKINLRREDYLFIVAYTKYLEFNDNIDTSLALNINMLKGVKNIEDTSMLRVIFSLVVEQTVRAGLSQLLSTHKELKNKSLLFEQLPNLLTLDTSAFFIAMEGERDFLLNMNLYKDSKEKYLAKQVGKNYKFLMKDVQHYVELYQNDFYNKMFDAMKKETPEAMNIYEKEMNEMKKEHMNNINSIRFFASSLWIKIKSLLGIEIKDFGYFSQYLAYTLVYVATPKINEIYLDYLQHIQKNKLFLEKFKN